MPCMPETKWLSQKVVSSPCFIWWYLSAELPTLWREHWFFLQVFIGHFILHIIFGSFPLSIFFYRDGKLPSSKLNNLISQITFEHFFLYLWLLCPFSFLSSLDPGVLDILLKTPQPSWCYEWGSCSQRGWCGFIWGTNCWAPGGGVRKRRVWAAAQGPMPCGPALGWRLLWRSPEAQVSPPLWASGLIWKAGVLRALSKM